jgi:energy-coupling factor transporter ATP-binding protein EcfA2
MTAPANSQGSLKESNRDLFLSYNSRDREAIQAIRQQLQARNISTFLDRENLIAGESWVDALQEAIAAAQAVAVFIGKDGLGVWQKREMALALDKQADAERNGSRFPVVPVILPQADIEKAPGFLLLNTFIDLRSSIADADALEALTRAIQGQPPSPSTAAPVALCPYRALRAFREEDAALFFGREVFSEGLLEKTLSHDLVAVVGPSGSGKSSVVQAGLMPLLRSGRTSEITWDAIVFTPGKRPFHRMAAALVPLWELEADQTERLLKAEKLGEGLAGNQVKLSAAIEHALLATPGTDRILVIVDQFEELFTLTSEDDRKKFMSALLEAADSSPMTIILTLRADFYSQAIELDRNLSDKIQRGLINLGPMKEEELRRAIENPARCVGLEFESKLADRILNDVLEQPGNLPLLEFALAQLWEKRQGRLLTHQAYDEIGKVEGSISRRAEELFARLPSEQQSIALSVMTRLVRVAAANEEGTDTRQRVNLNEMDAQMLKVAQSFVDARLFVTSRNETTNEETVEVAHEALIRRWNRLKELLNKDREFLLWRQRLNLSLAEWQRTKHDEGTLLRGALYEEAKRWLKERENDLNESERAFIAESERENKRPRRWIAAAAAVLLLAGLIWFG